MCVLVCVSKLLDSLFSSMGLSVFLRINALFVCFLSQVSFSVCKIKLPHFIFFFQNVLTLFGPLLFHLPFRIRLLSLKKKKISLTSRSKIPWIYTSAQRISSLQYRVFLSENTSLGYFHFFQSSFIITSIRDLSIFYQIDSLKHCKCFIIHRFLSTFPKRFY